MSSTSTEAFIVGNQGISLINMSSVVAKVRTVFFPCTNGMEILMSVEILVMFLFVTDAKLKLHRTLTKARLLDLLTLETKCPTLTTTSHNFQSFV